MPIQAVSIPKMANNTASQNPQSKEFKGNFANANSVLSNKKKIGIFTTTLLGVGLVMAQTLKGKGYSLKINDIIKTLKTNPKKLGLFDVTYKKEHELESLVTKLAFGSVGGGLLGGFLFDKKENYKAKIRESVIQLVGNIFTPLACVSLGMTKFNNNETKILENMKFLKGNAVKIPSLVVSALCLVTGIFLGNKVGNLINQNVFHTNEKRKLKLSDMSPHVDDICVAASLIPSGGAVGPYISRIVPAALMVAGISTGFAQECPSKLKANCETKNEA